MADMAGSAASWLAEATQGSASHRSNGAARPGWARFGMAGHCTAAMASRGSSGQPSTRQGPSLHGEAAKEALDVAAPVVPRHDLARPGTARQQRPAMACHGQFGLGGPRRGRNGLGMAYRLTSRLGASWHGSNGGPCPGLARPGTARHSTVRQQRNGVAGPVRERLGAARRGSAAKAALGPSRRRSSVRGSA